MRKKIIALTVLIFALALLALTATGEEYRKSSVAVFITTPEDGEMILSDGEVVISYTDSIHGEARQIAEDDYDVSCFWAKKSAPEEEAEFGEAGETYTVTVTIEFIPSPFGVVPFSFAPETRVSLNGETRNLSVDTSEENKIKISGSFVCAPADDYTPDASIMLDAPFERVFDGKDATAKVWIANKKSDVKYEYQWSRDGEPIEGAVTDSVKIKNAYDSGAYSCLVTAKKGEETPKTATVSESITVQKRPVTVDIFDTVKVIGTGDPEFEYTVEGLIGNDKFHGSPERVQGEDSGNYVIGIGTLTLDEVVEKNYTVTVSEGELIIKESLGDYADVSDILSDITEIEGEGGSRIVVNAYLPSLSENHYFGIQPIDDKTKNEVLYHCEKTRFRHYLKAFEINYYNPQGKAIPIKAGTTIIINIPLTINERQLELQNLYVARYDTEEKTLSTQKCSLVEMNGATYVSFEATKTGLFVFTSSVVPPDVVPEPEPDDDDNGLLWLWVGVILVAVGAIVIIIVCLFMIRPLKKKLADSSIDEAFKEKQEKEAGKKPVDTEEAEVEKPAQVPNGQKVISFDDLEDE